MHNDKANNPVASVVAYALALGCLAWASFPARKVEASEPQNGVDRGGQKLDLGTLPSKAEPTAAKISKDLDFPN